MACAEFTDAINWSNKTTANELFPVMAYFTKHFGPSGTQVSTQKGDAVHYASGPVSAVNKPTPHLKGTLAVAKNTKDH